MIKYAPNIRSILYGSMLYVSETWELFYVFVAYSIVPNKTNQLTIVSKHKYIFWANKQDRNRKSRNIPLDSLSFNTSTARPENERNG